MLALFTGVNGLASSLLDIFRDGIAFFIDTVGC